MARAQVCPERRPGSKDTRDRVQHVAGALGCSGRARRSSTPRVSNERTLSTLGSDHNRSVYTSDPIYQRRIQRRLLSTIIPPTALPTGRTVELCAHRAGYRSLYLLPPCFAIDQGPLYIILLRQSSLHV